MNNRTFPYHHLIMPLISLRTISSAGDLSVVHDLPPLLPVIDNNLTAAGNTYKNIYEATSMQSGLFLVFAVNIITAILGILFYRYVILREVGLLSPEDVRLLKKYPAFRRTPHSYTPFASLVARTAPPMRWTNWRDFFTSTESPLSRDAQVYLLFQRVCIAIATICAFLGSLTLLPAYWFGGNASIMTQITPPVNLLSMLRSDRGIFERLTSHNLPQQSPLFLIQLPICVVVASCVIAMYTIVNVAAGESRSVEEWLKTNPRGSSNSILPSPRSARSRICSRETLQSSKRQQNQQLGNPTVPSMSVSSPSTSFVTPASSSSETGKQRKFRPWILFARGLPRDIPSANYLHKLLDTILPLQVGRVELVCQGKVSEARLLHNLSAARHRLEYLYNCADEQVVDMPLPSQTLVGRILGLFARRRTREQMIRDLETKISVIKCDIRSRRSMPVKDFKGCAFISFVTSEATSTVLKSFPMRVRKRLVQASSSTHSNNSNHNRNNKYLNCNTTLDYFNHSTNSSSLNNVQNSYVPHQSQSVTVSVNTNDIRAPPIIQAPTLSDSTVNVSSNSIIGEHTRTVSELDVPYFQSLCKGAANLLPSHLRSRLIPSPTNSIMPLSPSVDVDDRVSDNDDRHNNHDHGNKSSNGCEDAAVNFQRRHFAITKLRNMKAERAPKSGDVIWSNLGMSFLERSVREMVVQVMVFAILILFTSPVTMLTALKLVFSEISALTDPQVIFGNNNATASATRTIETAMHIVNSAFYNGPKEMIPNIAFKEALNGTADTGNGLNFFSNLSADSGAAVESLSQDLLNVLPSFLTSNTYLTTAILTYFPVLLLSFIFSIVPTLLRMTCSLEGYATRSAMEMSVFRKTSFYYVMNAVVLPSLALNTASEFLEMLYQQSAGGSNVTNALPILQRLFSGDIAYFLCCYIVQLALTGSVFWLMRIPQSMSMMIRRRMAVTPLEEAEAKCASIFDYPRHYAYCVTVMSTALLFGLMAPLLWFFVLFYFVCKHCVDVYTLRYVHPRTHIDGRLPKLSANFILIWTIVSELSLGVILYLQGFIKGAILTGILCIVTLVGCLAAPSAVGSRMMSMVAVVRDAALERMLRMFGGSWYTRIDEVAGMCNSSSSSTMSSLDNENVMMSESDSLLANEMTKKMKQHGQEEEQQQRKGSNRMMDLNVLKEVGNVERPVSVEIAVEKVAAVGMDEVSSPYRHRNGGHVNADNGGGTERMDEQMIGMSEDGFSSEDDELEDEECQEEYVDDADIESGGGSKSARRTEGYGTCDEIERKRSFDYD